MLTALIFQLIECPCGHEAQLWEKVRGGLDNNRYLCFTKKPLSTDKEKVYVCIAACQTECFAYLRNYSPSLAKLAAIK